MSNISPRHDNKQSINVKGKMIAGRDIEINQNIGHNIEKVTTPNEFITELQSLMRQLEGFSDLSSDVTEAHSDLQKAKQECERQKPDSKVIRRFLNNSKALLDNAASFAKPLGAIASAIAALSKLAPQIF